MNEICHANVLDILVLAERLVALGDGQIDPDAQSEEELNHFLPDVMKHASAIRTLAEVERARRVHEGIWNLGNRVAKM